MRDTDLEGGDISYIEFRNTTTKNQVDYLFQLKIESYALERPDSSKNHIEIGNI